MPQKDRLFSLTWDNRKYKNMSPMERNRKHEAIGTHYATGVVTLDSGAVFDGMYDMEQALSKAGSYKIVYHDGQKRSSNDDESKTA